MYGTREIFFKELEPHLNDLKKIFAKVIAATFILFAINYYFATQILSFFANNYSIISLKPYDSFESLIVVDAALTFAMLFPFIIYSVAKYFEPAINNKKNIMKAVAASIILFYIGSAFGITIFSNYLLNYFSNFSSSLGIQTAWGIAYFVNFLFMNSVIFGFVFQIPLVVFIGIHYNIFNAKVLYKNSVYGIPVVLLFSAWFTPPDAVSMIMMAVPILFLFYSSIFISVLVKKWRG